MSVYVTGSRTLPPRLSNGGVTRQLACHVGTMLLNQMMGLWSTLGGGLVTGLGAEDDEHPASSRSLPTLLLQGRLADLQDRRIGAALAHSLGQAGGWSGVRRLKEVSDAECNHEWLWQSAPDVGPAFTPVEYVTAVRLRLGAASPDEPNC